MLVNSIYVRTTNINCALDFICKNATILMCIKIVAKAILDAKHTIINTFELQITHKQSKCLIILIFVIFSFLFSTPLALMPI